MHKFLIYSFYLSYAYITESGLRNSGLRKSGIRKSGLRKSGQKIWSQKNDQIVQQEYNIYNVYRSVLIILHNILLYCDLIMRYDMFFK